MSYEYSIGDVFHGQYAHKLYAETFEQALNRAKTEMGGYDHVEIRSVFKNENNVTCFGNALWDNKTGEV